MTSHKQVVMVVEDDESIRLGLCDVLTFGGYIARSHPRGDGATRAILEIDPALVLLDVMLPGMSGYDILREVRAARPTLPIVMVTARGSEDDRVKGLDLGADDYVVKPFSAREVLARVQAVLRRSAERPSDVVAIRIDGASVDLARHEAIAAKSPTRNARSSSRHVQRVALSDRETAVLRLLAANQTRIVAREELLRVVWAIDPRGADTRAVDMQIVRLRETLASVGLDSLVETVRSKGYRLSANAEVSA